MSILITGGNGFVASNICRALVEKGKHVVVFDVTFRRLRIFENILDKIVIVKGNILDLSSLLETMKQHNVKGVIHTCALLPEATIKRINWVFKINVEGTVNVLEAARLLDLRKVVYTSTGAIYGYEGRDPNKRISEEEIPKPKGTYGVTKYMAEMICKNYADIHGIDTSILRLALIYGFERIERGRRTTPLDMIMKHVAWGKPIKIEHGGDHPQEYTYVKDVVNAIVSAYEKRSLRHRVFNIGKGNLTKLSDIADIAKKLNPHLDVYVGPGLFPGESVRGAYDITRAKQELKFEPVYDIEMGMRETVRYLKENPELST